MGLLWIALVLFTSTYSLSRFFPIEQIVSANETSLEQIQKNLPEKDNITEAEYLKKKQLINEEGGRRS